MKWLVDAQLPRRLAADLNRLGHDATHTLDLPDGNATTDTEVIRIATAEGRIVISKDRDFLDSFLVAGQPPRLLWVTTGNISNSDLLELLKTLLTDILDGFRQSHCIELSPIGLVFHS